MPRPTVSTTGSNFQSLNKPTTFRSPRFRSSSAKTSAIQRYLTRGIGITLCGLISIFVNSNTGRELTHTSENLQMWASTSRELQICVIEGLNSTFEQMPMIWGIALVILIWGIALALTFIVSLRESQSKRDNPPPQETPHDDDDDDSDDDWEGMPGRRLIH